MSTEIYTSPPPTQSTNISPFIKRTKDMKEKKQINMKIRLGSIVKVKLGDMEKNKGRGGNQENKKRIGGMCPCCGREEEVCS